MWISLAARHPVELMIVNALITAPLLYAAFTLAAWVQRERRRERIGTGRIALALGLVSLIWAAVVLIDKMFLHGAAHQTTSALGTILDEPVGLVFPIVAVTLIALTRGNRKRGLVCSALAALYVLVATDLIGSHALDFMTARERWTAFGAVVTGIALMGMGASLMTIPSHPGRTSAVLLFAWGSKLLEFSILSVTWPAIDVLSAEAGIITPHVVLGLTLGVMALGVVAHAEGRRLRGSEYRRSILRESEARFRTLADATHEGIVVHRRGNIVDANARFTQMAGLPSVGGLPLERFLHAPGDGHEDAEPRMYRAQGASMPVEVLSRPLGDGRTVTAVRDLTELRRSEAHVRHLAENDGLTGITNRRAFDEEVDRRIAMMGEDTPLLALLMIDLDRFKPVNDTYGHAMGDALLKALAARFIGAVRTNDERVSRCRSDVVARIGGDEFAAVCWVETEAGAHRFAERLRELATRPFTIDDIEVSVGASIGLAIGPRDGTTGEELRQAADIALYAAKDEGRGRTVGFEARMAERTKARLQLENDLREALRREQILLHYQVQHDLKAGGAVGYEALMRWRHPERGMISPAEFIPIAEETGLIVPLGRWALERAACDFAGFDTTTRVSVNVSPIQFSKSDIVADVARALECSGLDPSRLEIEVTEEVLIEDTDAMLDALSRLKALGVTLSLDDFGSGYSSLAYLTRFPFNKIKIDRSFIDRMASDDRSHALVRSILALASSLGLKVTAEGVETHGQLVTLTTGRCDEAQGYLLGRPVPFDDIVALAREERERLESGNAA